MVGDAKYFLHQNKPAAPCPDSFGMVNRDFRTIRHRHANHFTHHTLHFIALHFFQDNALRQFIILKQV
jgi:hypothetical protein